MSVAYVSNGNINAALGVRGGSTGAPSSQFRRRSDGTLEAVAPCAEVVIANNEAMVSISGGGGGYGHPFERAPHRVAADVAEGWISCERAENVYGVVLDPDGVVDVEKTERSRQHPVGN